MLLTVFISNRFSTYIPCTDLRTFFAWDSWVSKKTLVGVNTLRIPWNTFLFFGSPFLVFNTAHDFWQQINFPRMYPLGCKASFNKNPKIHKMSAEQSSNFRFDLAIDYLEVFGPHELESSTKISYGVLSTGLMSNFSGPWNRVYRGLQTSRKCSWSWKMPPVYTKWSKDQNSDIPNFEVMA